VAVRAADDSGYPPRAEVASIETDRVSRLFVEKLNVRVPSEDTDLIEAGLLDSLALVELLFEIEREFGVSLPLEELEVDSFRTTRRIGELIQTVTAVRDA
jgi:acyl carrier protein